MTDFRRRVGGPDIFDYIEIPYYSYAIDVSPVKLDDKHLTRQRNGH